MIVSSELLHMLIDHMVIHEKEVYNTQVIMKVEIYYRFIWWVGERMEQKFRYLSINNIIQRKKCARARKVRCKKCANTHKARCNFCDKSLYYSYIINMEVHVCTEFL